MQCNARVSSTLLALVFSVFCLGGVRGLSVALYKTLCHIASSQHACTTLTSTASVVKSALLVVWKGFSNVTKSVCCLFALRLHCAHSCRVKMLLNTPKPHNQVDAEVAAGMGRPDNGPKLRSSGPADMVH